MKKEDTLKEILEVNKQTQINTKQILRNIQFVFYMFMTSAVISLIAVIDYFNR